MFYLTHRLHWVLRCKTCLYLPKLQMLHAECLHLKDTGSSWGGGKREKEIDIEREGKKQREKMCVNVGVLVFVQSHKIDNLLGVNVNDAVHDDRGWKEKTYGYAIHMTDFQISTNGITWYFVSLPGWNERATIFSTAWFLGHVMGCQHDRGLIRCRPWG